MVGFEYFMLKESVKGRFWKDSLTSFPDAHVRQSLSVLRERCILLRTEGQQERPG